MNNNKKLIIGIIAIFIIIFCIDMYDTIKRVGRLPAVTLWEDLSFHDKIAAKLGGYNFETQEEQNARVRKIKEQQEKDKKNKMEEKNKVIMDKINKRIDDGEFTSEEFANFFGKLTDKMEKDEISPEKVNDLIDKLADGKINIQDYLK